MTALALALSVAACKQENKAGAKAEGQEKKAEDQRQQKALQSPGEEGEAGKKALEPKAEKPADMKPAEKPADAKLPEKPADAEPVVTERNDGADKAAADLVSVDMGKVESALFTKPPQAQTGKPKVRSVPEHQAASVIHKGPYDGIGMAMGMAFGFIGQNKLVPMGAPVMVYLKDPKNTENPEEYVTEIRIAVAIPEGTEILQFHGVELKTIPGTDIAAQVEIGPYDKVALSYGPLAKWIQDNGYEIAGPAAMADYSDPRTTTPEKLLHEIYFPVKKP